MYLLFLLGLILFAVNGCSTTSELFKSSGCFVSSGGPVPGLASGKVIICRSGRDTATLYLNHEEEGVTIVIINGARVGAGAIKDFLAAPKKSPLLDSNTLLP